MDVPREPRSIANSWANYVRSEMNLTLQDVWIRTVSCRWAACLTTTNPAGSSST